MFRLRRMLIFVVLGVLMAMGSLYAAQSEAEPSTFFMTFVPNVQFSQMYVGIEKGYFAEAGFDLTLEYGNEPDGVELIALGEREFGLIAGEQVILARANDRPVVSVYEWWQAYPIAIMTNEASGIVSPPDLVGRKVGVPGRFGASYSGLTAFLNAYDLTEFDITLESIGFSAPDVLCAGGVEAAVVYGNNEPLQVAARVAADDCDAVDGVRVFSVADAVDLVSNGLVTSEAMIADQPERVASFVAAYDRAVRDVIANPAEAYLISANYIEGLPLSDELRESLEASAESQRELLASMPDRQTVTESREVLLSDLQVALPDEDLLQLAVLLETVQLWDAERTGYSDLSSWEVTQDTLIDMGFMEAPIDLSAAYTNDFLPE